MPFSVIAMIIVWTQLDVSCPEDSEISQLDAFFQKLTELSLSKNGQNNRKSMKTCFHKMAVVGAKTQLFGKTKVTTLISMKNAWEFF